MFALSIVDKTQNRGFDANFGRTCLLLFLLFLIKCFFFSPRKKFLPKIAGN